MYSTGEVGDKFYIIINGDATVTKMVGSEQKYLDTRRRGEWFGDVALIRKTLRTASITANNSLTCFVLEEKHPDDSESIQLLRRIGTPKAFMDLEGVRIICADFMAKWDAHNS